MRRTYKYRLYPTRRQVAALESQLGFACDLYNSALEQRRDWWKRGRSVSRPEQERQLTALRAADLAPEDMNAWAQHEVLRRLELAFEGFFRRLRRGERPGYPRFRSRRRYDSLTWQVAGNGGGCAIKDGRLRLQGVGAVRVKWHREIPDGAKLGTATVCRSAGRWHVCFALELPASEPRARTHEQVGIDLGVSTFAALSTGECIQGPRAFRAAQRKLRRRQRRVHRRKRGSRRQQKARDLVARQHDHIREVRRDHRHKLARSLVERFDRIYVEDLQINGLACGMLAKDCRDQGWRLFLQELRSKAAEAGSEVVAVPSAYTSQLCSSCGAVVQKPLSERTHRCDCGYTNDRDVNAAKNILRLGRGLQVSTRAVAGVA